MPDGGAASRIREGARVTDVGKVVALRGCVESRGSVRLEDSAARSGRRLC